MTKNPKLDFFADLTGELAGTFILVFFGCSSVAVTVLFSAHLGLLQVAAVWGMGVALAIYATRHITCAHLNPAVSVAMVVARRMSYRKLPAYLSGQFLGAFLAATVIYLLFSDSIINFELIHDIQRGSSESVATAMIFGEFYPNPGNSEIARVSMLNGFLA
jgi:glycerol uptake facilitator protein